MTHFKLRDHEVIVGHYHDNRSSVTAPKLQLIQSTLWPLHFVCYLIIQTNGSIVSTDEDRAEHTIGHAS